MATASTAPASTPGRTLVTLVFVAAGVGLLVWQVERWDIRAADLAEGFVSVGPWFLLVLALAVVRFGLRSYAWRTLIDQPVPLVTVVAASISGDALGNVTPLGVVASEPAKTVYLRRVVDPARALPALTAENFFYSVSVAIFVVLGTAALLTRFDVRPDVERSAVVALGAMAVVLAGAAWLAWQRPSLASMVVARLPTRRLSAAVGHLRTFEAAAYGAAGGHRGRKLAVVTACEAGFHLLSFVECWLIFWLLTGVSSLLPALIFDAFNRVVNVVFKFVPMRLGVEEGGTAVLAEAIGFTTHSGFLLGIVRKVRVMVFAAVGLALWGMRERKT